MSVDDAVHGRVVATEGVVKDCGKEAEVGQFVRRCGGV